MQGERKSNLQQVLIEESALGQCLRPTVEQVQKSFDEALAESGAKRCSEVAVSEVGGKLVFATQVQLVREWPIDMMIAELADPPAVDTDADQRDFKVAHAKYEAGQQLTPRERGLIAESRLCRHEVALTERAKE